MLVQEYLRAGNSLDSLREQYGIGATLHPTDGRVILDYKKYIGKAHKLMRADLKVAPLVKECRALVLDQANNWNLVARSFERFLNLGEDADNDALFDWSCFRAQDKQDGSLILLYHYAGDWHVNTRASFGSGELPFSKQTWREIVFGLLPNLDMFEVKHTYIFELCSEHNKVVQHHPEPKLVLLSVFDGEREFHPSLVDTIAEMYGLNRPRSYKLSSIDECRQLIDFRSQSDPTYEGLVLRDWKDHRLKLKSAEYLRLHTLANNGDFSMSRMVDLILSGELDELLVYYPEIQDRAEVAQQLLDEFHNRIDSAYAEVEKIEVQKDFALAIANVEFKSLLFTARKMGVRPSDLTEQVRRHLEDRVLV